MSCPDGRRRPLLQRRSRPDVVRRHHEGVQGVAFLAAVGGDHEPPREFPEADDRRNQRTLFRRGPRACALLRLPDRREPGKARTDRGEPWSRPRSGWDSAACKGLWAGGNGGGPPPPVPTPPPGGGPRRPPGPSGG